MVILAVSLREENNMQKWTQINDKFIALSQREKWLIFLSGLIGFFFILLTLLIDPVIALNKAKQQQIRTESGHKQKLQQEVRSLTLRLKSDPDAEVEAKLKKLSKQSQKLSLKLSEFVGDLISPPEMATMLETVLASSTKLKLTSLESLSSEPVLSGESDHIGYYIHPVRIELTGKYFDIQEYLTELEAMKISYYWREFHYQVEEYPMARLVLVVYTLGTRQEFIGG